MKAFLLAAGVGARLRPLTDTLPKCLVPVGDTPLLGIWFRLLAQHGVNAVLVNTHHLAAQVEAYVSSQPVSGLDVTLVYEEELLGSAGTVAANRGFVENEEAFFILYADNLTNVDLSDMYRFHRNKQSPFTMGLFETSEPRECGIASLDETGRVRAFIEKPVQPESNLANSGLYVAGPSLFDLLPEHGFADFGFDVIPLLVGKMYGYPIGQYFCDLGTPERLARARRDWVALQDAKC